MKITKKYATPMMVQYTQIKNNYPDCIIFFRLGDFYEMFLEDAKIGAEVLGITLTKRSRGKDGNVPMAGVPYHAVENYLSKMVEAGYKVAICEQLDEMEQIEDLDGINIVKREVVRIVTPGTLLTTKSVEDKKNNYICSLIIQNENAAICISDLTTGDFLVVENKLQNNNLKPVIDTLSKYTPKEVILTPYNYDQPQLTKIITQAVECKIYKFENEKSLDFHKKHIKNHFQIQTLKSVGLEDKDLCVINSSNLLCYLKETQKNNVFHINKLSLLNSIDTVYLDRATINNLELISTLRGDKKVGTLFDYLDNTKTSMGSRMLKNWVLNPLYNKQKIEDRLNAVEYLIDRPALNDQICENLKLISDIERLISKLSLGIGNPRDLINLKNSLELSLNVNDLLKDTNNSFLQRLQINKNINSVINIIKANIKDEPSLDPKNGNIINNGVNNQLDELKNIVLNSKDWMQRFEETQIKKTKINNLKIKYNKVFGYYIEISKSNLDNVPEYFIRKQTLVNAERYITPELKEHEEIVLNAEEKINLLEYEIFIQTLQRILEELTQIQQTAISIATIDCICNFAYISQIYDFCKPTINTSDSINIVEGRHPVVESFLEDIPFVPNDTQLDTNKNQLLILTGPNMAGKSVYLRQVAIITLLSQIGCYAPAKSVEIGIVDKIFVRSGASDAISEGISTFMMEMVETANILNNATSKSLIIMDEIGRGTSTFDGISIAWAIAEYLVSNDSKIFPKTLFATHYHELQDLENKHPKKVKNYQMAILKNKPEPILLHKLIQGGAEHSYGIQVAKLAGLPEQVINKAQKILANLEKTNESN